MKLRVRILKDHRADCYYKDTGGTPWYIKGDDPILYRDLRGYERRGSWRRWQPFRCNNLQCGAKGIVLLSDIESALHSDVKVVSRRKGSAR